MKKKEKKPLVVFTGGGTGGHVYPGLAVLERLRESRDCDFLWIGSAGGMEQAIVRSWNIPYRGIPSGKLRRYFSLRNFTDVLRIGLGFFAALFIFLRRRPAVVFSKGGYVSFPPVFAAWLLRIPAITHESDFDPGLATRLNAPFVKKICVPYGESLSHFPARFRGKLAVTGNPVRREIFLGRAEEGLRIAGFSAEKPLLLVLGGSLGAAEINALARASLDSLLPYMNIVHQTGEGKYEEIPRPGYFAAPYFSAEFPHLLAAAAAVVSRAGAGSLWEFLAAEKPALLIPLKALTSRGDQLRNARLFEELGAAKVLDAEPVSAEDFTAAVKALLDSGVCDTMKKAMRRIAGKEGKDAAALCAGMVLDYI
ncbi:MAG: glycosyltransferase [Spirochaetales bacterium]|jgi:UDP-N-acetylglucosamine--N-acetylmuramyl-(pentapeptide) pyrophosphoryl-undecaprenol N-acetylglucosamine transferase|nr:glycosyltransferase [Spirochaetales bacterium]